MRLSLISLSLTISLTSLCSVICSDDRYQLACPSGSRCYGAKNNYSAIGYRGCIRTFDCNVQINIVPQKGYGGFDFSYFVCLRVENSTLSMYFTPDNNNTDGEGMVHAVIRVNGPDIYFHSFLRDADQNISMKASQETRDKISGFHLSNDHLVQVKVVEATATTNTSERGLGSGEGSAATSTHHVAEGLPILECSHFVMFFSRAELFLKDHSTSYLNLKNSEHLYLKIRLSDRSGETVENVSITLSEPRSGGAVIFILMIALVVALTCTKCCGYCAPCRKICCPARTRVTPAQPDTHEEIPL